MCTVMITFILESGRLAILMQNEFSGHIYIVLSAKWTKANDSNVMRMMVGIKI